MTISEHANNGLYGTFLGNSYYDKYINGIMTDTLSLWTYINKNQTEFVNSMFDSSRQKTKPVLVPSVSEPNIIFWTDYYFRWSKYLDKDPIRANNKIATEGYAHAKSSIEQLLAQNQEYISRHQLQELYTAIFLANREPTNPVEPLRRVTIESPLINDTSSDGSVLSKTVVRSDVIATGLFFFYEENSKNFTGYLHKKGGQRRNWTTRWFVCSPQYLSYYTSEEVRTSFEYFY